MGPTLNWIQCDSCQSWELFENSGLGGKFDGKALGSVKFDCRYCRIEKRVEGLVGKVKEVEEMVVEVKEQVGKLEAKAGVELADRLQEVSTEVERKMSVTCENELVVIRGAVEVLQARIEEAGSEVDSRVAVGEGKCEEKIGVLERAVAEMKDGLQALGMKVEEFAEEFPKPAEWKLVEYKKKKDGSVGTSGKVQVGFASKFKSKAKDTMLLVGASLVRGVGQRLEKQCPHMVTAVSRGGAKIQDIEEEVGKLVGREDRHLVVMVGTNDIQREGSEVVLKKFKSLIERCRGVRNRVVTVVGIPRRYDLSTYQESRRYSVNVRLERMCRESGVEFLPCELEQSRMWRDRVHFNDIGQDEVARKIFNHCVGFLD